MNNQWFPLPMYLHRKNLTKTILKKENLKGKSCIEIGYGAGDMLLLFAKYGLKVYGYDFSKDAYNLTSKRINSTIYKNKIHLYKDENEISKRKYDYLFAFEVLEHIKDDYKTLKEWSSLLNNNGKIIISVPAHLSRWSINDISVGHFRRYEKKRLEKLLNQTNIKIEKFWNYGFPLELFLDPLNNLYSKQRMKVFKGDSKKELTQKSFLTMGKMINIFKLLSNDFILSPFYILQKLFLNKDIGAAYLVFGKKRVNY